MNFNRNLTRKLKKISQTTAAAHTSLELSSTTSSSSSASSTTTICTNVKTTQATIFTTEAPSPSPAAPAAEEVSTASVGMCDTRTTARPTSTATTTSLSTTQTETPSPDTTTEVILPLTSMSSQQILLTSRVNIMDKDITTATVAATTTTATTTSTIINKTVKTLPSSLSSPSSSATTTSAAVAAPTYFPILATTTIAAKSFRKQCLNIKMPLRHLILTIMAAVVFSMEFTICSGSSVLLPQHLNTMPILNNTYLPKTVKENSSYEMNNNLKNLPVTSRTTHGVVSTTTTSRITTLLFKSSVPPSYLSIDNRPPVKSMESAALVEKSSSTSSLSASIFDDSSSSLLSTLTGTYTETLAAEVAATSSSILLDEEDVDSSNELLSKSYNVTDFPPLTEAEQAAKDLLTKGFSIPTYLPPFPVFAVADLPAYLNTVSTTTTTESPAQQSPDGYDQSSLENLLYFANLPEHEQFARRQQYQEHRKLQKIPKRNSSLSSANVTVQVGNHAYLPCHIHRLQNKPVSWVRLRDGHIISVDQTTFIADQRFQAIFQDDKEFTWSLQIKYVQPIDEGWYECQASSEPKMSAKVYLNVIVPLTELIGDQSRFVKAGSKVALHCIVRGTLDPPQYIIWYRDKSQISEHNKMGWYTQLDRNIFGNRGDTENTIGSLIIPLVRKVDSGNYTCQPSNSASVSVDLHVLSGEYSASAIMSGARTYTLNDYYLLLLLFLLMLLHKT